MAEDHGNVGSQNRYCSEHVVHIVSKQNTVEVDTRLPLEFPDDFDPSEMASTFQLDENNLPPGRDDKLGYQNSIDMENGSDGDNGIPYVDEDGDQSPISDHLLEEKSTFGMRTASDPTKFTSSCDRLSEFNQTYTVSATSDAVCADLDAQSLNQADLNGEEVEFGEQENMQRYVPSLLQHFDEKFVHARAAKENSLEVQVDARRESLYSKDQLLFSKQSQDNMQHISKNDATFYTRNGKPLRRKQKDDKAVVIRSEQVEGHRGNDDLPVLLEYIEGPDALKKIKEDQGKRTKKKSQGTADIMVSSQRKEKSSTTSSGDGSIVGRASNLLKTSTGDGQTALVHDLTAFDHALSLDKNTFVTVVNKKQNNMKSAVRREKPTKIKRSSTPPPPAVPRQNNRQRRNSYDFCGPEIFGISLSGLSKDISVSSIYSIRKKPGNGMASDAAAVASQATLDTTDSELVNISLTSIEGDTAMGKISYASVTAAVGAVVTPEENIPVKENSKVPFSPMKINGRGKTPTKQTAAEMTNSSTPINLKDNTEFPALSTMTSTEIVSSVIDESKWRAGSKEPVSLPPTTGSSIPVPLEDISFLPENFEEIVKNIPTCGKDLIDTHGTGSSKNSSHPVSGGGIQVLQMIFDSCEQITKPSIVKQHDLVAPNVGIENSDQPVEFLGMAANQTNVPCGISFIFGDEEDDMINTMMIRSALHLDISGETSSMLRTSQSIGVPNQNCSVKKAAPAIVAGPGSENGVRDMMRFSEQAWYQFTLGLTNLPYYIPSAKS